MNGIVSFNANSQQSIRTNRVMVVDDHTAFRGSLRLSLEACQGFRVVAEASSCQEALTEVTRSPLDLIFMDRFLPDGDSIQIIRSLQQSGSVPKIVIFSSILEEEALIEALLLGASGYLTKDILLNELDLLLQSFLRGDLLLSPSVSTLVIQLLLQKVSEQEKLLSDMEAADYAADSRSRLDFAPLPPLIVAEPRASKALTPQESKVYQLLSQGFSNKQIAASLSISPYTVGKHVQHILHKLGAANRTQAVSYTHPQGRSYRDGRQQS